ncbi:hypothetical protein EC973_001844 [Apophysomyces ossiformis]|uniref:UBA domain-containing protein n=1 Tax=Apophysomyces ossiformis TaxID=679940 RepID=A0A8H7BNN0_9FUNG|nr:hypothetical protein EC973_001844 [Apophysomyces ossiformis]
MQSDHPFKATLRLPALKLKPIEVEIQQGVNVKDAVHAITKTHSIPSYLFVSVYSAILAAMTETRQRQDKVQEPFKKAKSLHNQFVSEYQAHTLQYHNKPEEDIFPRAYHTLVHCPISSIFDTLLELEQGYATSIQELYAASENEREEIQARHAREIELSPQTQVNMTSLFARHVEEMELSRATWDSDILQTQQTQRREYREFVIELYREYQLRLAALSNEKHLQPEDALAVAGKKLDGKEIVAAAASRVRQWSSGSSKDGSASGHSENQLGEVTSPLTRRRQSSSASFGSQHSHQSASPNDQSSNLTRPSSELREKSLAFQKNVKSIEEMGFSKEMAETALMLTNQDVEQSVQLLIENPQKVANAQKATSVSFRRSSSGSHIQRPPYSNPSSPAHSRNNSYNEPNTNSRRHSLQKLASTPAFLNLTGSNGQNGKGKGWSPISFLQQQKQAMENTNLSSVRRFGSWLGKAMENLGIEHDESDPRFASSTSANSQQLVESFNISLGTAQVKSAHNFRLLAADMGSDIFNPAYEASREMAYKAQTATKLYTSHLSAMIVLVELKELKHHDNPDKLDWRHYKSGKGSNKALFERCQHSTEFHFPDIESQLSAIENDIESSKESLQEGSFFITRHSNLPLTQVIFHLVIDSDAIVTTDLSNRHNLISGLRNILRLTTRFDISSLSIPLLLLPDSYLEQPERFLGTMVDQAQQLAGWVQKRGEVTMKCVKGFLIENSRNSKRVQTEGFERAENVFGGGMRNVEFLLPCHTSVYGSHHPHHHHHHTNYTPGSNSQMQELEYAFQQFRTVLVNLFRTS